MEEEEEDDQFLDEDDLDEDLDIDEDEDEEEEEEEEPEPEEELTEKRTPIQSLSKEDKFCFFSVQRAHGTSSCPHTAKIDIGRVRSFADLTRSQLIYNEEDFEFKEKLGEGFFANVKKCVSKRSGQEMVLKELKLNCVSPHRVLIS